MTPNAAEIERLRAELDSALEVVEAQEAAGQQLVQEVRDLLAVVKPAEDWYMHGGSERQWALAGAVDTWRRKYPQVDPDGELPDAALVVLDTRRQTKGKAS